MPVNTTFWMAATAAIIPVARLLMLGCSALRRRGDWSDPVRASGWLSTLLPLAVVAVTPTMITDLATSSSGIEQLAILVLLVFFWGSALLFGSFGLRVIRVYENGRRTPGSLHS